MDITQIINSFRFFLNTSWPGLPDWIKDEVKSWHVIDDWYQTNWETLVETEINQIIDHEKLSLGVVSLEVFGCGADCNGISSRVFKPEILPTHFVQVNNIYRFDSLGIKHENGWFEISYPFDSARVFNDKGEEIILPMTNLTFKLIEIKQ